MRSSTKLNDPWRQTLGLLALLSGVANAQTQYLVAAAENASRNRNYARVQASQQETVANLIDRPTACTATITWCDSTSCHYGEQIWRACIARRPGVCALSGMRIDPGDAIYKPLKMRAPPANADQMILSSVVNNVVQA